MPGPTTSLGADLRVLRRARGMTLVALAERAGRSVGWLSQVERDLSVPAIADLRVLASALGVPMSALFPRAPAPVEEAGLIVRRAARRPIGSRTDGLTEELLSPDLTDAFEVVESRFEPGAKAPVEVVRATQELGYVLSGCLDLTVAGRTFRLHPGDSFRLRGQPFRWANPGETPCIAIWVIAPPVY
jgi:transcriptional regulator with XRE-family HTH domain